MINAVYVESFGNFFSNAREEPKKTRTFAAKGADVINSFRRACVLTASVKMKQ